MEAILINIINSSSSNSSSSSSDSDSEEELRIVRKCHKKNEGYVLNVVQNYDLNDFRMHFRMSKESVEMFITELQIEKSVVCPGRPPVPVLDAMLLTIWCLANQESYRCIGDRFGFSKGHTHGLVLKMCQLISQKTKHFIVWPRNEEAIKNIQAFNKLRGANSFPNVFGCVDGTHIEIPGPSSDNSYYNRKGYHSMLLQCICNYKQEIIDIYFGWPGSVHDARMWKNSPIYENIVANRHEMLPNNSYLLGDSAYPLDMFMMVPFKDNGNLTRRQKLFNQRLSSTRVTIEQCYGRLKGMFRRLKYLYVNKLSYAKYYVFASAILHNFILRQNENDYAVEQLNEDDNQLFDMGNQFIDVDDIEESAVILRNEIMNSFL